jgi:diguanylate cyclase (GGDEF)-like protein
MKILIAEDDRASRTMLGSMLNKWGYEVIAVEDGQQAWEILKRDDSPQLAILDWMMPEPDGIELCRKVRSLTSSIDESAEERPESSTAPSQQYTYIILLSAKPQKEDMITGLEAGADDYIVKPFNADELQARLRAGRRIVDLHNKLLSTQNKLRHLAGIDFLTGIMNRRAIIERLKQEMARSHRESSFLCLAMLDIDHFKNVNDTHGHHFGDQVLVEFVARVQSVLREYDVLGRFGGEEFLLIIPGTDLSHAGEICERIRFAVGMKELTIDTQRLHITVSIGVGAWNGETSLDQLITLVDDALYKAKGQGRNRVFSAE